MTIIGRIQQFAQLWRIAIPGVSVPNDQQFYRWCEAFDDTQLERAICRAAKKIRNGTLKADAEVMGRYITGVALHEREKTEERAARTERS